MGKNAGVVIALKLTAPDLWLIVLQQFPLGVISKKAQEKYYDRNHQPHPEHSPKSRTIVFEGSKKGWPYPATNHRNRCE